MQSSPLAERASATCRSAPEPCWKRWRTEHDYGSIGIGRELSAVNLAASSAHDVLRANSGNEQGVRDERSMTAARQRFSAHRGDSILLRRTLHQARVFAVIGIAAKEGIPPASVGRIALGMANVGSRSNSQAGTLWD